MTTTGVVIAILVSLLAIVIGITGIILSTYFNQNKQGPRGDTGPTGPQGPMGGNSGTIYGSMTTKSIIPTQSLTFTTIPNFTANQLSGVIINSDGTYLQVTEAGDYSINMSVQYQGPGPFPYSMIFSVFIDGMRITELEGRIFFQNSDKINGNVVLTAIKRLNINSKISIQFWVNQEIMGGNVGSGVISLNIVKVGN